MKIAILGLGTVGSGVYEGAQKLSGMEVRRILDRHLRTKISTCSIEDILGDPEIELIAETMGGLHPAYEYARAALASGRHFVTANKQLVSAYGAELAELARQSGAAFLYGAACGGGIPYLYNLEMARKTDRVTALGGILNGTTNYILDAMTTRGADYDAVLREAQALGYAERDPSSDVDGLDTMRKLVLACAVGFGAFVREEEIPVFGISRVLPEDIAHAARLGCVLKLCAHAENGAEGLSARVEPALVRLSAPEAAVHQNLNYAWYLGEGCGAMRFSGQGAGKLPTASNVLRDIASVSSGHRAMTDENCRPAPVRGDAAQRYYLRVPAGAPVTAAWIETRQTEGAFDFIKTVPVPVQAMHAFANQEPRAFFAGIERGL